ncbi:MAG: phage virion morphogenesis protein [Proteobacteria bacterium]|nr:phage virion morphogenesis protein [Pseudomonadota bacterium]MBU1387095.1 phage virion morphogenesis protein [Pseudomonadota bacterium]MBU1541588.1 phage virion morphogenesis protein [Pseudomonadota bacterium]MBU2482545.1 phage virion morphogenesis protein [Pseudomonadota bacterium]
MAGDGVHFIFDDTGLQQALKSASGRISNMNPVMKAFSEYMVMQTDDRFKKEQAPDGSRWQALSPMTVKRKADQGKMDKILQQDGYLRLVHPHADKDSAGIYSDRIYAAIHNRGGKAGRNRSVTIPKREFLGFSKADLQEFVETCKDFIVMGNRPS